MNELINIRRMSGRTADAPVNQGLLDMIERLEKEGSAGRMVEIGTHIGVSTRIFAERFHQVDTVDPYLPKIKIHGMSAARRIQQARKNLEGFDNVTMHRRQSIPYSVSVPDNSLDFVYLDGNHTVMYVAAEILMWLPKTTRWIGGHDYCRGLPGVMRAVDSLRRIFPDNEFIKFKDSSWLFSKK